MSKRFLLPTVLTAATLLTAHPMGNFSVSHYARFEPKAGAVDIVYVLDLAELPTFDLLRQWGRCSSSTMSMRRQATPEPSAAQSHACPSHGSDRPGSAGGIISSPAG